MHICSRLHNPKSKAWIKWSSGVVVQAYFANGAVLHSRCSSSRRRLLLLPASGRNKLQATLISASLVLSWHMVYTGRGLVSVTSLIMQSKRATLSVWSWTDWQQFEVRLLGDVGGTTSETSPKEDSSRRRPKPIQHSAVSQHVGSFIKQFVVLTNSYCERDGQLLLSQSQAWVFKELSSSQSDAHAVVSYVIRFLFKYDWSVIMGVATFECRPLSGYLTKTRTSVASRVYPSKLNRTFFGVKML